MRSLCVVLVVFGAVKAGRVVDHGAEAAQQEPVVQADDALPQETVSGGGGELSEEYDYYGDEIPRNEELPPCEDFQEFNALVLQAIQEDITSGVVKADVQGDVNCTYTDAARVLLRRPFMANTLNLVRFHNEDGIEYSKEELAVKLWSGETSTELGKLLVKKGEELKCGCAHSKNKDLALCVFSRPLPLNEVLAPVKFDPEDLERKPEDSEAAAVRALLPKEA